MSKTIKSLSSRKMNNINNINNTDNIDNSIDIIDNDNVSSYSSKDYPKEYPNKITFDAGLRINVNSTRKNMTKYFSNQDIKKPMFQGSHVALTALIETLCREIISNAEKYANKDAAGLKRITRQALKFSVCINEDLHEYYHWVMRFFKKEQIYSNQLSITKQEMKLITNSIDESIILTPKAHNFLSFLLLNAYLDVLDTAFQLISFAKRKTLNSNSIIWAVKNRFNDNLAYHLCLEINRVRTAVGENIKDEEECDDNRENENNENDNSSVNDNKSGQHNEDNEDIEEESSDGEIEEVPIEKVVAKPKKINKLKQVNSTGKKIKSK